MGCARYGPQATMSSRCLMIRTPPAKVKHQMLVSQSVSQSVKFRIHAQEINPRFLYITNILCSRISDLDTQERPLHCESTPMDVSLWGKVHMRKLQYYETTYHKIGTNMELLKQIQQIFKTKQAGIQNPIELKANYPVDRSICINVALREYNSPC